MILPNLQPLIPIHFLWLFLSCLRSRCWLVDPIIFSLINLLKLCPFSLMIFHNPENSGDSGSTSIPDVFLPVLILICLIPNYWVLLLNWRHQVQTADDWESKYLSASYKTVAVRYRFLPAILMEFPSDESSDWKYARIPKLLIINMVSIAIRIPTLSRFLTLFVQTYSQGLVFLHPYISRR